MPVCTFCNCPGSGWLLGDEASVPCRCLLCSRGALWTTTAAGQSLFLALLLLRDPGGCPTVHQAVQREGGPGLNHVDPPDGDQEARSSAGLLGVQGEVAQESVGSSRPRGMRADEWDQTALFPQLENQRCGIKADCDLKGTGEFQKR